MKSGVVGFFSVLFLIFVGVSKSTVFYSALSFTDRTVPMHRFFVVFFSSKFVGLLVDVIVTEPKIVVWPYFPWKALLTGFARLETHML